jgi:hypothetical protein
MPKGAASHKLVDPSISVNRNVTVPDGAPTSPRIPHPAHRGVYLSLSARFRPSDLRDMSGLAAAARRGLIWSRLLNVPAAANCRTGSNRLIWRDGRKVSSFGGRRADRELCGRVYRQHDARCVHGSPESNRSCSVRGAVRCERGLPNGGARSAARG